MNRKNIVKLTVHIFLSMCFMLTFVQALTAQTVNSFNTELMSANLSETILLDQNNTDVNAKISDDEKSKIIGEKLLRQLWVNLKKKDKDAVDNSMAKGFQSVHQFGANNREQEIKLIKNLKLGNYTLSSIKITRNGPVIVATYLVSVKETIKGKELSKKPAPRLTVFLKTDKIWKWIAHANLKPLK